jgi:hydrogenase 3 maturation protease
MAEKKTSNLCWKAQLGQKLNPLAIDTAYRVAVLGIGNELNGDDSAGIWVARKLSAKLTSQPNLLVMDCGSIPENASGPLRKFKPQLILMIDAADLQKDAGTIEFVDLEQVRGFSASSHTLPLSVLARYLKNEFKCEVALCCIQLQQIDFETKISPAVNLAVEQLVDEIISIVK